MNVAYSAPFTRCPNHEVHAVRPPDADQDHQGGVDRPGLSGMGKISLGPVVTPAMPAQRLVLSTQPPGLLLYKVPLVDTIMCICAGGSPADDTGEAKRRRIRGM